MSANTQILDWTMGAQGVAYQSCSACKAVWYFRRTFCPTCGSDSPREQQASGLGTVHAATQVARAPNDELRPYAPYVILLVDADEGFRLMAHGDSTLKIGDRVRAHFTTLAGKLIPHFEKAEA